jgi:hypothetical protein
MQNGGMYSLEETQRSDAVEKQVVSIYSRIYPQADRTFVGRAFEWAKQSFSGNYGDYQPIDTRYHNFEHTMQGTFCLTRLLMGRHMANALPAVPQKMFELSLLAILLHDTGYLKKKNDTTGTGAKYTAIHVLRSVDFARELLSEKGYKPEEITAVQNMIRCTGLNAIISAIRFQNELEKLMGLALATADLLGQMAADDYVEKLPVLYEEFAEAVTRDPQAQLLKVYTSPEEVMRRTPAFWNDYVVPRINKDFRKLYLFLNDPYPDGPNPYVQAIEANMARIRKELADSQKAS